MSVYLVDLLFDVGQLLLQNFYIHHDGLAAGLGLETDFGIMFLALQSGLLLHETLSDVIALPELREDRTFGDKESDPFLIESPCIFGDHSCVRRVRLLSDDPAGAILDTDGVLQPAVDAGVKKSPWQEETIAPGMLPTDQHIGE